jgi:flagellar basal body-associated protein FliL
MENSPSMKRKTFLVIIAIVVVIMLTFCIVLFLSEFSQKSGNYENKEIVENMTLEELNETIKAELNRLKLIKGFTVTKMEIDEEQKNITLYEIYMNDDQIADLQGKEIGGWKVNVIPDVDYMKEMDAAENEVMEMKKDPELQISGISMTSGNGIKEIRIWVYNRTPENEALEGKVIHGWTIHISGPGYRPGYVSTENK